MVGSFWTDIVEENFTAKEVTENRHLRELKSLRLITSFSPVDCNSADSSPCVTFESLCFISAKHSGLLYPAIQMHTTNPVFSATEH